MVLQFLELLRPGVSVYQEIEIGGKAASAAIELVLAGTRKLTEARTLREIPSSVTGLLLADVASVLLEDQMVAVLLGAQADAGIGVIDPQGYHFRGRLEGGVLTIGDQPTPLLESFGPALDEEIQWDELLGGLRRSAGLPRPAPPLPDSQ